MTRICFERDFRSGALIVLNFSLENKSFSRSCFDQSKFLRISIIRSADQVEQVDATIRISIPFTVVRR